MYVCMLPVNLGTWMELCECMWVCVVRACCLVMLSVSKVIYLLTYLLTYSMVQSPSWVADWLTASQEIPRISRNPKVHYRTHKRPPPVPILGQPDPVHMPTSHLLEIHSNIIHPPMPRSPQWSLSLRFPHQDPVHPLSPHPYMPHAQPISFFSILSPAQYSVRSTTVTTTTTITTTGYDKLYLSDKVSVLHNTVWNMCENDQQDKHIFCLIYFS